MPPEARRTSGRARPDARHCLQKSTTFRPARCPRPENATNSIMPYVSWDDSSAVAGDVCVKRFVAPVLLCLVNEQPTVFIHRPQLVEHLRLEIRRGHHVEKREHRLGLGA